MVSSAKSLSLLGDRIRAARQSARLSQAALGRRVGVTAGAVAQWESVGGTQPGIDRLVAIADATRTSFEWLGSGRSGGIPALPDDGPPAFVLDTFALDATEEVLLERFRQLSPRARSALTRFLDALLVVQT